MTAETLPDLPAILGGRPLFPDGPPSWPPQDELIIAALKEMAADGSWGRYFGTHGDRLIEQIREMYGCEHVVLCSSGRAAIELALRGVRVEPGDEVVMAAYDFRSNFADILQVGATPVLVDVRSGDAQMDVSALASAISSSTRAVIASHLHGGLVDMPSVRDLADEGRIAVVEDACQASGATVAGRPAGLWGDVGVLSFGGSKLLTAGRGGALLTNRSEVIQRIRRHLRGDNHAYPLSEMQAAVLSPQLHRLPERHQRRSVAVAEIRAALAGCPGLQPFECGVGESSPAFYKVGMFYDASAFDELPRESFVGAMRAEGLAVDAGFSALQTVHSQRRFRQMGGLHSATAAGETVVGLHHPVLLDAKFDWSLLRRAVERVRRRAGDVSRRPPLRTAN